MNGVMPRNIAALIAVCGFNIYTLGFVCSTLHEQALARPHIPMTGPPPAMMEPPVYWAPPLPFMRVPWIGDPFRGLYHPAAVLGAIGMLLLALAVLIPVFSFVSAYIGVHRRPI